MSYVALWITLNTQLLFFFIFMGRYCYPLFNFASSPFLWILLVLPFFQFSLFSFHFWIQSEQMTKMCGRFAHITSDSMHCHISRVLSIAIQIRVSSPIWISAILIFKPFEMGARTSFIVSICFVFIFCSIQVRHSWADTFYWHFLFLH